MMTDTLYIRIRIASGQFRWFAFTVRDRKAILKEYRIMRHAGKARRSIARMHVVCLLFATVGGDLLPLKAAANPMLQMNEFLRAKLLGKTEIL